VVAVTNAATPARGAFSAPGRDVPTTQPGARWGLVSGSSYSAAHVSGLAALVRQRSPRGRSPLTLVAAQAGAVDACATLARTAPLSHACASSSAAAAPAR
jgi:subtilisin family serine protease